MFVSSMKPDKRTFLTKIVFRARYILPKYMLLADTPLASRGGSGSRDVRKIALINPKTFIMLY